MKIHPGLQFFSVICCFFLSPVLLKAQEGNHCAVKKSPFRLAMESGNKIFTDQCRSCHHTDSLKTDNGSTVLNGKGVSDKMKLIEIMIKGGKIKEDISGNSQQKLMPAYPDMKDQDIADVLTYIRNSFGNKESAVKVSEVKSVRGKLN